MPKFNLQTYSVGNPEWKALFDQIGIFLSQSDMAQMDGKLISFSTDTAATSWTIAHGLGYQPNIALVMYWYAVTNSYVGFSVNCYESTTSHIIVRSSTSIAPKLTIFVGRKAD